METVKINNNQNIIEKHFNYTDLFNILFTPLVINKTIQSKDDTSIETILKNYAFLAFLPYLTIDNLPSDFEDYRYIYINAPLINTLTDKQFSFSLSNSTKTKSLFSGCGENANITLEATSISGNSYRESYACTNNVLTDTFDFTIDKQLLIPYELRTSRNLYVQIPSFLISTAINNIKNTIMSKANLYPNNRDSIDSIFDIVSYYNNSSQLPYIPTILPDSENPSTTLTSEGLSLSDTPYNGGRSVKAATITSRIEFINNSIYKANVIPDNHNTTLIGKIIQGRIKEMSPQTYNNFLNYINFPLTDTAYNGMDTNKFNSFLTIPQKGWFNSYPITLTSTFTDTMLNTIFQSKDFYKGKKFSIYFSKEPMGI